MELGVLGPLQVRQYGLPVTIPGAKPRAVLTMLGLHGGSVVSADALLELLWGDDPPRTAAKALQTHISSLRRALGDGFIVTQGGGWTLCTTEIDAIRYKSAINKGRDAIAAGDASQAVAHFDEALTLWRGVPELPDGPRGVSEKTRWLEGHASLVEDRADAVLATGRAAEIIGELEAAVAEAPLRERRWGQLMLALYRAGRQGEALGAFKRARALLVDELGVEPGPDLRRLEAAIVAQDSALEVTVSPHLSTVTRAVTFLLTDIEGSTAAWEADADAMAAALARHDEIVEQVVTSRGGRLIKTRGEGDATFSVFDRPSSAALAAIELQEAIRHEPWNLMEPMQIRVALHTGEVELRDGDYFGRAVNRAARLRSLACGGQILCSGATAELVIDSLPEDVVLADLGTRQLRNLARPEHVFELSLLAVDESPGPSTEEPMERPALPAVLAGPGPFVGRGDELGRLLVAWQTTLAAGTRAVLISGEPGVGKTRLAGEWSRQAYDRGAVVLYGRCDEDLGAHYQPFAEALRALVPNIGANRLRRLRGVEALLALVPRLGDVLPDLSAPHHSDPDTERYALFDAVVALLEIASAGAPVVLVLDDLHWAAKPTLLLMRHLLRFGERARVQIVGTYRSTDLDRSHPLAAMLADLHRDGSADRLALGGLDERDVSTYVAEVGYDDEELARALAAVTGGNPFFLIEALRHVEESGGHWDPTTLPQGVREAVSRRLSRLTAETNKALATAAVIGSRFAIDLVERVLDQDLVDAFDEAGKAGIVIEEHGGCYRFNHALVRQSLLAELPSMRRMRLHQHIAATLESEPNAEDLLGELAHHYFECAWAGNAAKAVHYCRRAADQAMARLAYESAADHYDKALHALDEIDDELPDRDELQAELLIARCEALLAANDVVSAKGAVEQLQAAAGDSTRLTAWGTCFDGQLSMLTDPERLDEIEAAVRAAAKTLAGIDDAAGEANAHTVRAGCLARLGRIADCETALDQALTAARRARDHRRVNAVLVGAPLAALWGPNPVPRAGGRCLDVVRLLRITTGSPAVEATSKRCQGLLDAFRGRAAAGRQLIDSARRTLTELGMRHALLEVDQFAGLVELVADDPAAAEPHLRRAYNGFRRMRLDADTAETAALLAGACLLLGNDVEADELCVESERLAGHALKPSIAWRTVRAQLLARSGAHDEARRAAEEAVALAERTDALVDHGDACLALATVSGVAGDSVGARAAAERALALYERKGAAALAEKASRILGSERPPVQTPLDQPMEVLDNACVKLIHRLDSAYDRSAWGELEKELAPVVTIESRRKVVGMPRQELPPDEWLRQAKAYPAIDALRHRHVVVAVRGDRLALTRLEIGTADVSPGAPRDELLQLYGLDEDGRLALHMWFDTDDMDAAIAELGATYTRLEGSDRRAPLENAAVRADDRLLTLYADNRLDDVGALFSEDTLLDDRRHGLRRESNDRETAVKNIRAIAGLGVDITKTTLALRGDRLCLSHMRYAEQATGTAAFYVEGLEITEVDTDGLMVAKVDFDLDNFEAAFAELDARYLAGEAAPYAGTWSVIAQTYAGLNRGELPARDLDTVDHRHVAAMAPGEGSAYFRASWELAADLHVYIEAVHRLTGAGVVVTHVGSGTSQDGFEAEWRGVDIMTVEADRIVRAELFDEADLDAAIARFDELTLPVPRLENRASRVGERYFVQLTTGDWDAITEIVADNFVQDDRRRVVGAGIRHGLGAQVSDIGAFTDLSVTNVTSTVVGTRGENLVLSRVRFGFGDQGSGALVTELLGVGEVDTDGKIRAAVAFDPDDIHAAFEELDARYLGGEASAHAQTWSVIVRNYAAFNRHEMPLTTRIRVINHRRGVSFQSSDLATYIRSMWDFAPNTAAHIEAVHRLTDFGAVFTQVAKGSTHQNFEAEWREICLLSVDGERIGSCELFDEADLDAAVARFDDLTHRGPPLENAATRAYALAQTYNLANDWKRLAQTIAEDLLVNDRRLVVGAGTRHGRDEAITDMRATAALGITSVTSAILAIRGERLALVRSSHSRPDQRSGGFLTEVLVVYETNVDGKIAAAVVFGFDEFDAAFAELEMRFLAGEAAEHANTWLAIVNAYTTASRHELPPMTPGLVSVDHRRGTAFPPGRIIDSLRTAWDITPNLVFHIETVHALNDSGAVITRLATGTSQDGFDAEWRSIDLLMVDNNSSSHYEVFEEADLESALARFDDLSQPAPRLENAVSRVAQRFLTDFEARNWDAMYKALADDYVVDDRRHTVTAGFRQGRELALTDLRATVDVVGIANAMFDVIATRGDRLVLTHTRYSSAERPPEGAVYEILQLFEADAVERLTAVVVFDLDDIDTAFDELDARYIAGEAAQYAQTWTVVSGLYAAFNQREFPEATRECLVVDHRQGVSFASGVSPHEYLRAAWEVTARATIYIEAVHGLSDQGAVITHKAYGTSQDGFDAEWRKIDVVTVDGPKLSRHELFDEHDLDSALARFDELTRSAPQLENAASRVYERFNSAYTGGNWEALATTMADDFVADDRRRLVGTGSLRGRDAAIAHARTTEQMGVVNSTSAVVAMRGEYLALMRARFWGDDPRPDAFHAEVLHLVAIDPQHKITTFIAFDTADIDAAFAELDARYLAGEAAPHARIWSVVAGAFAAIVRHEIPAVTPDWANVDHRRGAVGFVPGDLISRTQATWDDLRDFKVYIESVHQLNDDGAAVTYVGTGTSTQGFEAEWREISMSLVDGDLVSRTELYDECDLDAALARFDQLVSAVTQLQNAATQVVERFRDTFATGGWDAIREIFAENFTIDDRRLTVNAGLRHGRDAEIDDLRAAVDVGFADVAGNVIATRGAGLALLRVQWSGQDQPAEPFSNEWLGVVEVDPDERVTALVILDIDAVDSAFEELDARYLAGEAAAFSDTWSRVTANYAELNRHQLPRTTPDWVSVDHRRVTAFATGELTPYIRAGWELGEEFTVGVEAVHRLTNLGAVVTTAARGISRTGFEAEWRQVVLLTFDGDLLSRCELFDGADVDAALARFDELSDPPR
ncbi:BTAD domain-containing putative transcriptional regulator [Mycolicibacterium sp. XJ662]